MVKFAVWLWLHTLAITGFNASHPHSGKRNLCQRNMVHGKQNLQNCAVVSPCSLRALKPYQRKQGSGEILMQVQTLFARSAYTPPVAGQQSVPKKIDGDFEAIKPPFVPFRANPLKHNLFGKRIQRNLHRASPRNC
jgi:hypothetical protein